jgi:integrase
MPRRKPPDPPRAPPQRRSPGTGSVGTRADGRVFAILPPDLDPHRKPHYGPGKRRRFTNEDEARAWLAAEIERRRDPSPQRAARSEPLGAYLARWYKIHAPSWPERTRRTYRWRLRVWAKLGHIPLGALSWEHIQGEIARLLTTTWRRYKKDGTPTSAPKRYEPSTIAQARITLHHAIDALVPDAISYNPVKKTTVGRIVVADQPVYSADQVDRFLETAGLIAPRLAFAFRLVFRRALRVGELADLRWSDVDARRMLLVIDETAGVRLGESGPPKGRKVRDVPLSVDLVAQFWAYRRLFPSETWIFTTDDGHRVSFQTLYDAWNRVTTAAGLPRITPKDARASCATILLDEGQPLPLVARLLGHSKVSTTAAYYARVIKRRVEQTARLGEDLDASFQRATERANVAAEADAEMADRDANPGAETAR